MNLPSFPLGADPGPDFARLVRSSGLQPPVPSGDETLGAAPHGTTCLAIRYADGVIMAGDRRATSGHLISHRNIEKVFPGDRYSGVAVAGAAGPAVQMVRLFQLQLEHYEKVEGDHLSLEGKANQLSQMVAQHLPMAMQGLAVIPIFAGFDLKRTEGRLFQYDVTGGRYEEADHTATGSGSLHAGTVVKIGWRPDMTEADAVDLVLNALYQAAEEDSATGGPDLLRGIYPIVATITDRGFERVDESKLAERTEALIERLRAQRQP